MRLNVSGQTRSNQNNEQTNSLFIHGPSTSAAARSNQSLEISSICKRPNLIFPKLFSDTDSSTQHVRLSSRLENVRVNLHNTQTTTSRSQAPVTMETGIVPTGSDNDANSAVTTNVRSEAEGTV